MDDEQLAKHIAETTPPELEPIPVVVVVDPDCKHVWAPHTRTGNVKLDHCPQCGTIRTA
jgi:hypothetical protein